MTDETVVSSPRGKAILWKPGQSGNPAGRPKGSRNAITLAKLQVESELRGKMKHDMQAVLKKITEMALAGDSEMLKLLYKSWVSSAKAAEDEAPREKVQIVIGKLEADKPPPISGRTMPLNDETVIDN